MFITQEFNGQKLLIEKIGQPSVYLDNWALNDISLESSYRKRFINVMNNRKGTLRLSISNLVELLKKEDQTQISSILSIIDSVDTGFINIDFREVIKLENAILRGEFNDNPSKEFRPIKTYLLSQNWPESWAISDVINSVLKNNSNERLFESWDQFAEKKMKNFLDSVRSNSGYTNKLKEKSALIIKKGKKYDRATRELLQLGFNFVLQQPNMTMPANEWHDFFHTIVPVAYCDIVLLDSRWTTFISQTQFKFPDISYTFNKKSIEDFFNTLETINY